MINIGILTISDKGSKGQRQDKSGEVIREGAAKIKGAVVKYEIVPDEKDIIADKLADWADGGEMDVILTTGGTGLSKRDVTPEATKEVIEKEVPGIPEAMRTECLKITKRAMLSRAIAGIRKKTLIVNLPGQPKSIKETLEGVKDAAGKQVVPGIFAAVPYCLDLMGGPYVETHEAVVKAFRPKSALRRP